MLLETTLIFSSAAVVTALIAGPRGWRLVRDKLTKGKYIFEKETFDKILREFEIAPEDWRVDSDSIKFPVEGSYKIWISKEDDGWTYFLNGGSARKFPDYYSNAFGKAIALEYAARLNAAASRIFTNERLLLK